MVFKVKMCRGQLCDNSLGKAVFLLQLVNAIVSKEMSIKKLFSEVDVEELDALTQSRIH